MKIPVLREMAAKIKNLDVIWDYLSHEHTVNLREIVSVLQKLDLSNNFISFTWQGEIPANTEISIENRLRNGLIPSMRIIVRSNVAEIADGDAEWTKDFVSLKNTSATDDASLTVVFLK